MDSTECPLCWVDAHADNPGNPDGTCATIREVLESECLKAKRIIDSELGDTWPFCDVLNEHFVKCSARDNPSKNLTTTYLSEKVDYGGEKVTRGEMIRDLQKIAKSVYPDDKMAQERLVNVYLLGHGHLQKSGNPDGDLEEVTIIHRLEDNPGNPDTREIERELAERGMIF